ncbi:MAG TPA: pitrilysin family protein [Geobacteraceae bacterium]|nr:pitrilysin family protein [Geobacteraceae bacterium]
MMCNSSRTLPNGLKVVAVQMPHLHSAELALYVKVGGRNDPPGKAGLAHFLEHMLFRGTEDFPTSLDIETAFEAIGGSINASTDEECTCFFSRIHPGQVPRGVEILSSMLLRPLLSDLEIEKRIITEEALDDLSEKGDDVNPHNLASRLLWPGHQLGEPTIGTLETIASFTTEDLRQHIGAYYRPGNAVLVVAGNFVPDVLFSAAESHFSSWQPGGVPAISPPREEQYQPQESFVADADSQAHLQLSFRSVCRHDPRIMSLRLLRRILCGSGSARLHMNLRERLGIVYSVDANIAAYEETGYFSIELSTGAENLATAVAETLEEVLRLAGTPVPPQELERVRHSYFCELEYSRDSCYEMQVRYGWGELMGLVRQIEEDVAEASALTSEALLAAARELFRPANLNLVVVGAWQEKDKGAVMDEIAAYDAAWQEALDSVG